MKVRSFCFLENLVKKQLKNKAGYVNIILLKLGGEERGKETKPCKTTSC